MTTDRAPSATEDAPEEVVRDAPWREDQAPAAPPASLSHPPLRVAGFVLAATCLALSQSLTQGYLMANSARIAGDIGATQTQALWLLVAFMAPRASLPIMLIRIRTQFGLRPFAIVGLIAYTIATILTLMIDDLHSAIAVELVSGIAAAPLSSLAFLYILEPLPQRLRLSVGLTTALTLIMLGAPLARALTPLFTDLDGWMTVKLFSLGLALVAMPFIFYLPLSHAPRHKVLSGLDFVVYGAIALGFGAITAVALWGTTDWWTDTPWLGQALATAIVALTFAAVIELHRDTPLLDLRWIATPEILHLAAVLLLFRIMLSEQSAGAPGLFRALGLGPAQVQPLFAVIVAASLAGGLVCALVLRPDRVPRIHAVALALIALGAFMDSHSTVLTGPEQMFLSQGLIAFAGAIFMPSAMASGLLSALRKGPSYILSFVIIFLSTQMLGGVIGSALFRSFIRLRRAFHAAVLREELPAGSPDVAAALSTLARGSDPAGAAGAATALGRQVTAQATVMAYNDAFLVLSLTATGALALLLGHMAWIRLRPAPADPAPPGAAAPAPPPAGTARA